MPVSVVTNGASGLTLNGAFTGNGANVTNVNAVTLNGLNATNLWQLGGNLVAAGKFLGSTNNQPVELWVNSTRALRLEPTANDANHSNLVNVVGGSAANYVLPGTYGAVIAGGGAANYNGILNYSNSAAADLSAIGGGADNSIQVGSDHSVIGGGFTNTIQASAAHSVIGGGEANLIQTNSNHSFIGSGYENTIQPVSARSVLAGGESNLIQSNANHSVISGGENNLVTGAFGTVPGGNQNTAAGDSLAAGSHALATNANSFVWSDGGTFGTTANNQYLIHASGGVGINTSTPGAQLDVAGTVNATAFSGNGGGLSNLPVANLVGTVPLANLPEGLVTNNEPLVSLGTLFANSLALPSPAVIASAFTTIVSVDANGNSYFGLSAGRGNNGNSGSSNTGVGDQALLSITTGSNNVALGYQALSANTNGNYNTAIGDAALLQSFAGNNNVAIGFGALQYCTNDSELVAVGYQALQNDLAGNNGQSVSGLGENTALGYASLQGNRIGYGNTAVGFESLQSEEFGNGNTAVGDDALQTIVSGINNTAIGCGALGALGAVIGYQGGSNNIALGYGAGAYLQFNESGNIDIGNSGITGENNTIRIGTPGIQTATYLAGTVYANNMALTSDRNAKENFTAINPQAVLAKVAALPLTEWNYKTDQAVEHLGPMAQDFQAAFGLNGKDDKHIAVVDEGGVALAAIQGLNEKVESGRQAAESRIEKLEAENAALKQQLAAMQKEMASRLALMEKAVARVAEESAPTLDAATGEK